MYKSIALASALAFVLTCYASENDSIHSYTTVSLEEVVVEAPKIVRKADMDVLYPSESAIGYSKSGLQLLKNLIIPSVVVNEVLETVTTSGGSVQLRINGRIATVDQVKQLLPQTIKRIEWMDNPGLRYKGALAVLNFIVSNPMVGGSFMTETMTALNMPFDNANFSLKLNNGHSQFGISPYYKLSNKIKYYREYSETFTYADMTSLTRTEVPTGGYFSDNNGRIILDYSYIVPDTTTFYVSLYGYKVWSDASVYEGVMSLSNSADKILLKDYDDDAGFQPSLNMYLEQRLCSNQTLAVDFTASLSSWRNWRDYTEQDASTLEYNTDVHTSIRDRNQTYSLTADYIKRWKKSRLTAGVSYTANRNRSIYENISDASFHQRQDNVYFYGEYFQRTGKFTINAGIGAQYTSYRFRESSNGNKSWDFRPRVSLSYRHGQVSSFSLSFSAWPKAPTLSQSNPTPQQIDGFQWSIGNPELKMSKSYNINFRYNLTLSKFYTQFGARSYICKEAITPYLYWEGDKLITSYENSTGYRDISFWISPQLQLIPNWLTVSGQLMYNIENARGKGYDHTNRHLSGNVTAVLSHWGFDMTVQYEKAEKSLWGERISWGETYSLAALSYNWKNWKLSFGALCPFTKYDRGSRSLNKYNSNLKHIRTDMMPMPFVQVNYNLQWGRQKDSVYKLVNADSSVQRTSTAG